MEQLQSKLENPIRLEELKPEETLKKLGLRTGDVFCDIGAGSGVFTLPAARLTKSTVYALDIKETMLERIRKKAENENISSIKLIKVSDRRFDLPDGTADMVLLSAVLHEIEDSSYFLGETRRILKSGGRAAVIEFHKRQLPAGHPTHRRVGKEDATASFESAGFMPSGGFDLGDNYYCLIFQRP
jgi:ubiquinone/menaquinone biosynthesis C-methylase UbiE